MEEFGPARSVVLDSRDTVKAGNGTLEAFAAAGGTEVLVVEPAPGQLVAVKRKDWSKRKPTATRSPTTARASSRGGTRPAWPSPRRIAQRRREFRAPSGLIRRKLMR